jgi:hypothetical protein
MTRAHSALLAATVLLAAPAAVAQEESEDWDGGYDERAEHRSGFVAGLGTALVAGNALGYPNQAGKIDDPAYRATTRLGLGGEAELWIGGAIQDWFTFGLGYGRGQLSGNDLRASSTAYLFRVETYPFFYSGTFGRDFGLQADFGLGTVTINDLEAEREVADGGAMSVVGLGAVYEWLHFGSFAAGPTLRYRHRFSASLAAHTAALGLRLVYRSGP